MENEKMFELMEKMYSEMQEGFSEIRTDIKGMKSDMGGLKSDITNMKSDIKDLKVGQIKLEDRLDNTSKALFDGYKQNSDKLTRIEDRLSKDEEIILKRVK